MIAGISIPLTWAKWTKFHFESDVICCWAGSCETTLLKEARRHRGWVISGGVWGRVRASPARGGVGVGSRFRQRLSSRVRVQVSVHVAIAGLRRGPLVGPVASRRSFRRVRALLRSAPSSCSSARMLHLLSLISTKTFLSYYPTVSLQ